MVHLLPGPGYSYYRVVSGKIAPLLWSPSSPHALPSSQLLKLIKFLKLVYLFQVFNPFQVSLQKPHGRRFTVPSRIWSGILVRHLMTVGLKWGSFAYCHWESSVDPHVIVVDEKPWESFNGAWGELQWCPWAESVGEVQLQLLMTGKQLSIIYTCVVGLKFVGKNPQDHL